MVVWWWRRGGGDLKAVQPTAEELAEARATLAKGGEKKQKSAMASMAHWLKSQPYAKNTAARASRGDARQDYLLDWMVHSAREDKKAMAEKTVSRSHAASSSTKGMQGWLPYERVNNWLGKKRLDAYIQAKTIIARQFPKWCWWWRRDPTCPDTEDPELMDYWYEEAWLESDKTDSTTASLDIKKDKPTVECMAWMDEIQKGEDGVIEDISSGGGVVAVAPAVAPAGGGGGGGSR